VALPADQSLRCFNDPVAEMRGWAEALDEAFNALHRVFIPRIKEAAIKGRALWSEEYVAIYEGHIEALRSLIPWSLATVAHQRCEGQLPPWIHYKPYTYHYRAGTVRRGASGFNIVFFPVDAKPTAEPHYFAKLTADFRFCVHLPKGRYRILVIPEDGAPLTAGDAWPELVVHVRSSGLSISDKRPLQLKTYLSALSSAARACYRALLPLCLRKVVRLKILRQQ
jgi:hypothetical protein